LATLAAGGISGLIGPAAAYWMAAAMSGAALLGGLALGRTWDGGLLRGTRVSEPAT